jgi:hypothetical protein
MSWELFALVATIEVERHAVGNPPVPEWFAEDYSAALAALRNLALDALRGEVDRLVLRSALSLVAAVSGDHPLGSMLAGFDDSEIAAWNEEHLAYSERYRPPRSS